MHSINKLQLHNTYYTSIWTTRLRVTRAQYARVVITSEIRGSFATEPFLAVACMRMALHSGSQVTECQIVRDLIFTDILENSF